MDAYPPQSLRSRRERPRTADGTSTFLQRFVARRRQVVVAALRDASRACGTRGNRHRSHRDAPVKVDMLGYIYIYIHRYINR